MNWRVVPLAIDGDDGVTAIEFTDGVRLFVSDSGIVGPGNEAVQFRQDAGGLQVQLSATHREVAQQLHAVSDSLRQDLGQRQSLNVSVQVSDASRHDAQGQGGQGGQRSRQPQDSDHRSPHRALQEADGGTSSTAFALHPEQG